jgi:hypothetical protein
MLRVDVESGNDEVAVASIYTLKIGSQEHRASNRVILFLCESPYSPLAKSHGWILLVKIPNLIATKFDTFVFIGTGPGPSEKVGSRLNSCTRWSCHVVTH